MSQKRIQQIEFRLQQIKRALLEIGPMRPGSLTRQYKDPQHRVGAYWQISYTRRMKSRTEYVRKEWVKEVRRQIATHKRFKRLIDQWLDLSIEHSQLGSAGAIRPPLCRSLCPPQELSSQRSECL
jgi:hypothetical protein